MDKLDDVPLSDTEISDKEREILDKYFPQSKDSGKWRTDISGGWKWIAYYVIVFVILANPWIDSFISKLPYCPDNKLIILLIKALLFVVAIVIIQKFL